MSQYLASTVENMDTTYINESSLESRNNCYNIKEL